MISYISKFIKNVFKNEEDESPYKIKTLTYYIPSPPIRKTGYREKQFDKIFFEFMGRGHKLISIQTQTNTNPEHSGMWIICTVQATCEETNYLDFTLGEQELSEDLAIEQEVLEGCYEINE